MGPAYLKTKHFQNFVPIICILRLIIILYLVEYGNAYMVGNNPYHQRHNLDSKGNYQLDWLVHWNEERISFNVTVKTRGYVGFGLSNNGKMSGADIVIGGVLPNGTLYFSDYHAVGNQVPEVDPSQDWELESAWENGTHTSLNFSRAFETCDDQDFPINDDKISLIWAYGEGDDDIEYHHGNRGVFHAYLLHPDYAPQVIRDSNNRVAEIIGEETSDIQVWTTDRVFELPAQDTTYWCTLHKVPSLPRKHHIIGLEVTFGDDISVRHTHHIVIFKCNAPRGRSARTMFEPYIHHRGQQCLNVKDPKGPIPTEYCSEYVHAWAVGGRAYFNPPHVGLPMGVSQDEYFIVQVHYDNPDKLSNVVSDMRVDLFYTSKLRPNDAGAMVVRMLAPGLTPTTLIPPSSIYHRNYGHCSPTCTSRMFPDQGIKIYGVLLHSHNAGKAIRFQQFRNNQELPWVESDDNYSFFYQQHRNLREERDVLPGDQLVLRCAFDNTHMNGTVVGGFSSNQEMCTVWMFYHTRINNYAACGSEIVSEEYREYFLGVNNITWNDARLEYVVDTPQNLAGLTIKEVSDTRVNWDLQRRRELQQFHLYHPQESVCAKELYAVDPQHIRRGRDGALESDDEPSPGTIGYPYRAPAYQPLKQTCSFDKNSDS